MPRSRWKSFVTGWSVQAFTLTGLLFVSYRFHQDLVPPKDYRVTNLVFHEPLVLCERQLVVPPVLLQARRQIGDTPLLESKPVVTALVVKPQTPTIPVPEATEPDRPAPELKLDSRVPVIPNAPISKVVAVGTFSTNSPV